MTTTWRDLQIIRAKTLDGLKTGENRTIYTMSNPKPDGNDVWAPELHKVNGTWYVYYSQDRKSWVLTGKCPMNEPFVQTRLIACVGDDMGIGAMGYLWR